MAALKIIGFWLTLHAGTAAVLLGGVVSRVMDRLKPRSELLENWMYLLAMLSGNFPFVAYAVFASR